jgi:hypothetical protein
MGDAMGKSRRLPWSADFSGQGEQRGMNVSYIGRYVELVQNRIKNMSLLTIGVNLVQEGAVSPLNQPRDAARREECSSWMKRV